MPSLKYFNKLRNTIGHSAPFNLSTDDMKPLMAVLDRIGCNYDKTDIRDILDTYVGIVGAFLASTINHQAKHIGEWEGTPPPRHPVVPPRPPVSDGTGAPMTNPEEDTVEKLRGAPALGGEERCPYPAGGVGTARPIQARGPNLVFPCDPRVWVAGEADYGRSRMRSSPGSVVGLRALQDPSVLTTSPCSARCIRGCSRQPDSVP